MSARQLGIVFDINKCMGCATCTVACKMMWTNYKGMDHMWWCKVNTMPGKGSPKDWETMGGGYDRQGKLVLGKLPTLEEFGEAWEFNYEEVFYGGKPEAYLHPVKDGKPFKPQWGPNWDEDIGAGEYPNSYFFYLPRLCNSCAKPPCVDACPGKAQGVMTKREEDGIVLIDEEKCAATPCGHECMRACPYKVIYANAAKPNVSQMCNFCLPRLEREVAPCCVRQCPGRAAWIDYLDNKDSTVYKLTNVWKVAIPIHPEFNTGPNVYYVPPLSPPRIDSNGDIDLSQPRIPMEYLRGLFGPAGDHALSTLKAEMGKRRQGQESELMDLLIARRWVTMLGPFPKDPSEVGGKK